MVWYKVDPSEYSEVAKLYEELKSTRKVAELFNVNKNTICNILDIMGVNKNLHLINHDIKKEILSLYIKGERTLDLAFKYGISDTSVRNILAEFKLKMRSSASECKIYRSDPDYFSFINTELKAYFLGLLFSDGCNLNNKAFRISLTGEIDRGILDVLSSEIYLNHRPVKASKTASGRLAYLLHVNDINIAESLCAHGMAPRKSLKLLYPETVPDHLIWHFIRGYFDGDGCTISKKNRSSVTFSLLGTEIFLNNVKLLIEKCVGEEIINKIYDTSAKNGITKEIKIAKRSVVEKIYHLMYDKSTIWLKRKRDKFSSQLGIDCQKYFTYSKIKEVA